MNSIDCSFCNEFKKMEGSDFWNIYGSSMESRIVDEEPPFLAIPTIGQLFKGSILILPRHHIERMADIEDEEFKKLKKLVERIEKKLSHFGNSIIFEHGARSCTNGSCGIYHAHLCIVPLPYSISKQDMLFEADMFSENLYDAFSGIKKWDQYLLFRDAHGIYWFKEINKENQKLYPSQYFRRRIVEKFKLKNNWDWRKYEREDDVYETLNYFYNKE